MKRFWMVLIVLLLLACFTGCAGIQFAGNEQTQKVLITSAARLAAYKIALNNPELAAVALPYAQSLQAIAADPAQAQEVSDKLFPAAVTALTGQIKDPVVRASVNDVLTLIKIDAQTPATVNLEKINFALAGFIDGLILAKK